MDVGRTCTHWAKRQRTFMIVLPTMCDYLGPNVNLELTLKEMFSSKALEYTSTHSWVLWLGEFPLVFRMPLVSALNKSLLMRGLQFAIVHCEHFGQHESVITLFNAHLRPGDARSYPVQNFPS